MLPLIAAAAFFIAIHLVVAGTPLRASIVGIIGEGTYLGLFSLASAGGIVALCIAYNVASLDPGEPLWDLGEGVKHAGGLVIALAFLFVVPGLLTPNPTSVGQESVASKEGAASGMLRITRHPFLWGVALWAAFHLAANGDLPSVIFFGTFLLLTVLGTFSIDARRRKKLGDAWQDFASKTSNIPFAAILAGRNRLAFGELLTWRQAAAIAAFAAVMLSHHRLFGVSPFPGGWVPF